jgi:nitrate/nitrite transport system ATP-binding protein
MTNGPGAVLAEIVENPLPKERARTDVHKHPLYYALRNHIIDFLVARSRGFVAEAGATHDPRHVPIMRPGLPEPAIAAATPSNSSPSWPGLSRPSTSVAN